MYLESQIDKPLIHFKVDHPKYRFYHETSETEVFIYMASCVKDMFEIELNNEKVRGLFSKQQASRLFSNYICRTSYTTALYSCDKYDSMKEWNDMLKE